MIKSSKKEVVSRYLYYIFHTYRSQVQENPPMLMSEVVQVGFFFFLNAEEVESVLNLLQEILFLIIF